MKNIVLSVALCASLVACGDGNPFGAPPGGEVDPDEVGIPEALSNDLESFTYNPNTQTLTIRGVTADDSPFEDVYRRRPALDRGGYEAYTTQDGSLDRHSTAYVRDINGTRAALAVTGGQFGYYFAGAAYGNGQFTAPIPEQGNEEGGLVQYAGNYVGMLNVEGSGEDLLPVAPGTEPGFRPYQAAEVTGRILITASFADGSVSGIVTEREVLDYVAEPGDTFPLAVTDLELAPTAIAADGTFFGEVTQGQQAKGEYGGIFGGIGATEVAGAVHAQEHLDDFTNEEEYGLFVLGQGGTPAQDPVCNQPVP